MKKRVLLAGLFHETNTFLNGLTTLDDFEITTGEEIRRAEDDASPLAGALEVARERKWKLIPIIDLRAMPGAKVADEVVDLFWSSFQAAAERETQRGVDGIYLVLHGAMVSESLPDVEGELLRRMRKLDCMAGKPLCGVLDLHGNLTAAMARHADGLISYRENPHTDAKGTAMEAAYLLDRLMETGEHPITVWDHPPVMWPPSGTDTSSEPMRSLENHARTIEASHPEILRVNVFGGFPFADTTEAGVSFSAVTVGDPEQARSAIGELSSMAFALREAGNRTGMPLQEAIRGLAKHRKGPILLVEPSDNIGAGAPGEGTHLLRALLENRIQNAGVIINDPESVKRLWERRPGERVRISVGGKSGAVGSEPLPLEAELLSKSDGRFVLEDQQSHLASMYGKRINMGPCAVVRDRGVHILLTSRRTPPFDLGQWRSQNINPEKFFAIGIKAAAGHRRAYEPICAGSYTVDTPGPCAESLRRLPFRYVKRPIYPLDDLLDYTSGSV